MSKGEDWIEWDGGECPVGADDDVQVMLYGQDDSLAVTYAQRLGHKLHWDYNRPQSDWIIAYRIVDPAQ